MAVISLGKRWPNGKVPFEAGSETIAEWLLEINDLTNLEIFVRKQGSDTNYLSAKTGNGKSESIGYFQGCGEYKISAQRKQSMQHEALHALGFHHEQLHSGGPWALFDRKARNSSEIREDLLQAWGRLFANPDAAPPRGPSSGGGRPRRGSFTSGIKPVVNFNEAAVNAHKKSFDEAITDQNVMHILSCDFDSVMMYSQMVQAATEVGVKMVKTGKPANSDFLSNGDVQALKYMYNTCTTLALSA